MFPCFIIIYIKFLSTLSLRRATRCSSVSPNRSGFLSTLSLRRATRAERYANSQQEFLSTLSLRRATDTSKDTIKTVTNFYPRSPCGERQAANGLADAPPKISIHALLAESDSRSAAGPAGSRHFYPRSPCGERLAGAISQLQRRTDFYPRSPCGERLHAAHFFSFFGGISIHALLAESDATCTKVTATPRDFYPRSPCGERRLYSFYRHHFLIFLSTLSLRRATLETLYLSLMPAISIHALLAESDSWLRGMIPLCLYFYPRSPCGERRVHYDNYNLHCVISIHALLAESDVFFTFSTSCTR